jgi:hypothetical protein
VWYFRTVQTVRYFRTVVTVCYFRTVVSVWYFRTVVSVWYLRTVVTVWYFCFVFYFIIHSPFVFQQEYRNTSHIYYLHSCQSKYNPKYWYKLCDGQTNRQTDRWTDRQTNRTKTICLPTKVGGDIIQNIGTLLFNTKL